MDKLRALGRGTQIMFIAAVLLLIVSFFRWQEIDLEIVSAGQNAWHGFWGVVMGILTIILVARIAARLAAVEVPIPLSFATTSFVLSVLIVICAVMKVVTDDYRTFWALIGLALAIIVVVGAWLEVQEAGGIESLKSDATSLTSSVGGGGSSAAASEAPHVPAATTDAAETTSDAAAGAADAAAEAAGSASDAASSAADTAADTASEAADTASDAVGGDTSPGRES